VFKESFEGRGYFGYKKIISWIKTWGYTSVS